MRAKRVVLLAAAVTLVVAAAAVIHELRKPDWAANGPARVPSPHGYIVRYQVGQVFTDGLERVILQGIGHKPAILRKVEITGPSVDHFQIVGLEVAGVHRHIGSWEVSQGFPPHIPGLGRLVPGAGARLGSGLVGNLLLIGLKVVKPGVGVRTDVDVFYTVGGTKYEARFPAAIADCPQSMTVARCQHAYLQYQGG